MAINLRDLGYFIALADHLHFGKAAAASFVSQPTLSTQIRKLEDELGVALVERAPRNVMLTPAGREVAARARRIMADIEQMREAARRSQDPEAGTVTLQEAVQVATSPHDFKLMVQASGYEVALLE